MRVDVESLLVRYLRSCGFEAFGDVPDGTATDVPDEFVTVERTGGETEWPVDAPTIAVQAWAPTRAAALALCLSVDEAVSGFVGEPGVRRVDPRFIQNFPPYDGTRRGRYQAVYTVVTQMD